MSFVRNMIGSLFAICVFVRLSHGSGVEHLPSDREALWNSVFKNQVNKVAPSGPNGGPVVVNHSIAINSLISLEDDILTLSVWEDLIWVDTRLQWDPKVYNGLDEIRVPSRSIWQPDIILYNSAEEYRGFPSGDINAVVSHDGKVTFIPPKITKTFCRVNDDLQQEGNDVTCILKYGSWTHSSASLDLSRYDLTRQPNVYDNSNREWLIITKDVVRNEQTYLCCPETYVDITYNLLLRRKQDAGDQEVDRK